MNKKVGSETVSLSYKMSDANLWKIFSAAAHEIKNSNWVKLEILTFHSLIKTIKHSS